MTVKVHYFFPNLMKAIKIFKNAKKNNDELKTII